jgi:polysaccharide biosynthesis/export protein
MNERYVRLLASASLILRLSISPGWAQSTVPQNSTPTQNTGSRISAPTAGTASPVTAGPRGGAAPGGGGRFVLSEYALGPGDQITINALDAEEISGRTILIGSSGNIEVPLMGRVHAAGLTVEQLQAELVTRLKTYVKDPQVSVNVTEMRSQPVSIIGSVGSPGVHQLEGRKTLVEMLSLAGGVKPDAGYELKITRQSEWGPIPLPTASVDPTGKFNIATVPMREIMELKNPEQNILIMPHDIISLPRADLVYVIGDVMKAGSIELGGQKEVSVLQALSIAGGFGKTAKPREAKILRPVPDSSKRIEVPVDLKAVLASKTSDISMHPGDILFVPSSGTKSAAMQTIQAVIATGAQAIIFRIP